MDQKTAEKKLSEVEKEYQNTPGEMDRRFRAALDIAFSSIDGKIDPIKKRLAELKDRIDARPATEARRPTRDLEVLKKLSLEELKKNPLSIEEKILMTAGKLSETIDEVNEGFKKIREEIEEIKKGGISYCGVFQRALSYKKGSIVTFRGSAWVALEDSPKSAPGDGPAWQLFVKGGSK